MLSIYRRWAPNGLNLTPFCPLLYWITLNQIKTDYWRHGTNYCSQKSSIIHHIFCLFLSLHCPIYYQVLDSPFIYYLCKIVSIQIRPKFLNLVCFYVTGLTFEKQLKILLSQQISYSFENEWNKMIKCLFLPLHSINNQRETSRLIPWFFI